MDINKLTLRLQLTYYLYDLYDILTVVRLIINVDKIDPIQREKYDKQLCKALGSIQCIKDMYCYFNIRDTNNIFYNLIYRFGKIKSFDDKLLLFSNKDLLVPDCILYPGEYTDGYDEIIKIIRKHFL